MIIMTDFGSNQTANMLNRSNVEIQINLKSWGGIKIKEIK